MVEASRTVGVTKRIGYKWFGRWNESSFDGLIPRFAGGKLSKLAKEQKMELKAWKNFIGLWKNK